MPHWRVDKKKQGKSEKNFVRENCNLIFTTEIMDCITIREFRNHIFVNVSLTLLVKSKYILPSCSRC